jgi:hypothetical protein
MLRVGLPFLLPPPGCAAFWPPLHKGLGLPLVRMLLPPQPCMLSCAARPPPRGVDTLRAYMPCAQRVGLLPLQFAKLLLLGLAPRPPLW